MIKIADKIIDEQIIDDRYRSCVDSKNPNAKYNLNMKTLTTEEIEKLNDNHPDVYKTDLANYNIYIF